MNLEFGPSPKSELARENDVVRSAEDEGAYGLPIRFVKVEGRWSSGIDLPLKAGDILTPENLSAAMHAVSAAVTASQNTPMGLRSKGEIAVFYLSPKFEITRATDANGNIIPNGKSVGVILRPYYIDVALVQFGNNVLPIPRSAFPTFSQYIPKPLLLLNPSVAFGSALSAGFATDLFQLAGAPNESQQLQLRADGTKSLEEKFYRANGEARYAVQHEEGWLREFSIAADFDELDEPLGAGVHRHYAGAATLGAKLKLAPNTRLALDAGYRRAHDEFNDGASPDATADEQVARLLLEATPPGVNGFLRAALWEETAWQSSGAQQDYQRLVARIGYEKEIAIAPSQTIGLELIAGAGTASDHTPAYARFFGGNAPGQFLYDSADSSSLMRLPAGPLLRSFGENEARLRSGNGRTSGGDSFWHVNLNFTIPIRAWSRSLIPDEPAGIDDRTIKQVLIQQIDVTGPNMLASVLEREGLSPQAARTKAAQVLGEVAPAAHFIINDANVFSVKPLLMFDAAGLSDRGGESETWTAAGGGLQLTIVTAKLEAGYMHTISGPTFGHDGNAFVRLIFQNLF